MRTPTTTPPTTSITTATPTSTHTRRCARAAGKFGRPSKGFLASGMSGRPVVIAEEGDSVVVDPRFEPSLPLPLHQAFTFRGGRVVLIQDYPDRASALADLVR